MKIFGENAPNTNWPKSTGNLLHMFGIAPHRILPPVCCTLIRLLLRRESVAKQYFVILQNPAPRLPTVIYIIGGWGSSVCVSLCVTVKATPTFRPRLLFGHAHFPFTRHARASSTPGCAILRNQVGNRLDLPPGIRRSSRGRFLTPSRRRAEHSLRRTHKEGIKRPMTAREAVGSRPVTCSPGSTGRFGMPRNGMPSAIFDSKGPNLGPIKLSEKL